MNNEEINNLDLTFNSIEIAEGGVTYICTPCDVEEALLYLVEADTDLINYQLSIGYSSHQPGNIDGIETLAVIKQSNIFFSINRDYSGLTVYGSTMTNIDHNYYDLESDKYNRGYVEGVILHYFSFVRIAEVCEVLLRMPVLEEGVKFLRDDESKVNLEVCIADSVAQVVIDYNNVQGGIKFLFDREIPEDKRSRLEFLTKSLKAYGNSILGNLQADIEEGRINWK
ncbi:hypothetical protein KC669_01615 [Candidatus Dojkabacteria bacterium]|uniref:Uncharacterized protein n=1 Tax=Candidatus Dojkabacteria bacterium TaxID=2099670 RepID=A0A955RL59_9BACT|nr:hypothetical protein [Candidatus Dojkabacteria bacterium]